MIPQIGIQELVLIGVLALIVVGPKDLPLLMRRVGKFVGQAKRMAREFQSSFDELGRQAELEELRKEVEALKREATADVDKELTRANREIGDAMRDKPSAIPAPGSENRIAPPTAAQLAGQPAQPAPPPRPAGPRIETPAAQPRPRPDTAAAAPAEPAKTDQTA